MADVDSVSYPELVRLRQRLASLDPVGWDELKTFAQSMVAPSDISLMRRIVRDSPSGEEAGKAVLSMFTRGGFGNVTCEVRCRLARGDDGSDFLTSAPLVLAGSCRDLFDGTALRCLFEFSDLHDVMIELERLLEKIGRDYARSLLEKSREEQVDMCLRSFRENPSTRMLWRLRTYVDREPVRVLLREWVPKGQMRALESLFFHDEQVDWLLIDSIVGKSDDDYRVLTNLSIENIRRGADLLRFEASRTFRRFPDTFRTELYDGLRVVNAD